MFFSLKSKLCCQSREGFKLPHDIENSLIKRFAISFKGIISFTNPAAIADFGLTLHSLAGHFDGHLHLPAYLQDVIMEKVFSTSTPKFLVRYMQQR